jgi:hypothetical protein
VIAEVSAVDLEEVVLVAVEENGEAEVVGAVVAVVEEDAAAVEAEKMVKKNGFR